ncbi:MAG: putative 4-hydroxybenzoate polyprenyltransferase [Myxococcaceae bacterium]|nr:putative 4-hydroxybenzoate polyprenyltransferase [Myxococcaceae bacterium]
MSTAPQLSHPASTLERVGSLVKFSHTIFALPFALAAVVLALPQGHFTWGKLGLIVLAIAAARTAAMAFNRLVDRDIDADNPRTRDRELPRGALSVAFVRALVLGCCAVFVACAALLGPLPLWLSPVALALALGYSYVKRYSSLCHLVLGAAIAFAPGGAWIALGAPVTSAPWLLVLGVASWVGGFDILYSLQDEHFDRAAGLFSIPARFGTVGALWISGGLHLATLACLLGVGLTLGRGLAFYAGVAVIALILAYEHWLVRPDDLSKMDKAFFDLNGYVSVAFFVCVLADHFLLRG